MPTYDDPIFFEAYAQMDRSRYGLPSAGEWHQLKKLIPCVKGMTVLDIGCGYGWHCTFIAEQGAASVLGVDESLEMIKQANLLNTDKGITYQLCKAEDFPFPEETYDLVLSNLVLHYIEDLDAIYRKVYTALKPGGTFVFNIEHPAFTACPGQDWIYTNEEYADAKWNLSLDQDDFMVIHMLGVHPRHHGKGYAKQMVRYALDYAKASGVKAVRLDVLKGNAPAERLYPSLGFTYVDTIELFYEDTGRMSFELFEYQL